MTALLTFQKIACVFSLYIIFVKIYYVSNNINIYTLYQLSYKLYLLKNMKYNKIINLLYKT